MAYSYSTTQGTVNSEKGGLYNSSSHKPIIFAMFFDNRLQWNPDFSNSQFLTPPDFSNQFSFPLEVQENGILLYIVIKACSLLHSFIYCFHIR